MYFILLFLFLVSCQSEEGEEKQVTEKPLPPKKTVDPKYLQAYQNQSKSPLSALYQPNQSTEKAVLQAPLPNKWIHFINQLDQALNTVLVHSWKYEQATHANPKEQTFELKISMEIEDQAVQVERVFLTHLRSIIPSTPKNWPKQPIEFEGKRAVIQVSKLVSTNPKNQKHLIELTWIKDQASAERNINCRQIQGLPPQQPVPEWMVKGLNNSGDKKLLQASYEQKGKVGEWQFLIQYRNGGVRDEWADFWVQAMNQHQGTKIEQQDFYQSWKLGDQSTLSWWQESSAPEMGCIFESALMAVKYRLP